MNLTNKLLETKAFTDKQCAALASILEPLLESVSVSELKRWKSGEILVDNLGCGKCESILLASLSIVDKGSIRDLSGLSDHNFMRAVLHGHLEMAGIAPASFEDMLASYAMKDSYRCVLSACCLYQVGRYEDAARKYIQLGSELILKCLNAISSTRS